VVVVVIAGRHQVRSHAAYAVRGLVWALVPCAVLLAYPAWFAVDGTNHIAGPIQLVSQAYRADLAGIIAPDSLQHFAPASITKTSDLFANSFSENGSYLGIPLLLLLGAALVWLRRNVVVWVAIVMAAIAFILSLGGALAVTAAPQINLNGSASGSLPLPEDLLNKLPLLSNVIPSRFSLYVVLFASLILSVVLDQLYRVLKERAAPSEGEPAPRRRAGAGIRWPRVLVPSVVGVAALVLLLPAVPVGTVGQVQPPFLSLAAYRSVRPGSVTVLYPYPTTAFASGDVWQALADMHFRMPGGYFTLPWGPQHHIAYSEQLGYYTVPTLTAITLTRLANGHLPPETPALRTALLEQFRSWDVQNLIMVPQGLANPTQSSQFLTWLLGPPTHVAYSILWLRLHWTSASCAGATPACLVR